MDKGDKACRMTTEMASLTTTLSSGSNVAAILHSSRITQCYLPYTRLTHSGVRSEPL